ncbi:MAG: zinc ribbon domain-containing protein [Christensenellales bacterium]|jgi:hypothetical protein
MICTKCGKSLPDGAAVCPYCGSTVETENHWYLVENGAAVELPESELVRRIREGSVLPHSKICIRGATQWSDAKDTPLGYLFGEAAQAAVMPVTPEQPRAAAQQAAPRPAPAAAAPASGNLEEPVSMGTWFGILLLLSVPTLNFIMCIVWAANRKVRKSIRNLAKLMLILMAVIFAIGLTLVIISLAIGASLDDLKFMY